VGVARRVLPADCLLVPMQILVFDANAERPPISVLVRKNREGWRLDDGAPLAERPSDRWVFDRLRRPRCREVHTARFVDALEAARERPWSWEELRELADRPPARKEWLAMVRAGELRLRSPSLEPDPGRELIVAFAGSRLNRVSIARPPGWRHEKRVDVEALLLLDLDRAVEGSVGRDSFDQVPFLSVSSSGELFTRNGRKLGGIAERFDSERVVLPPAEGPLTVPLSFTAEPGEQLLVLALRDTSGRRKEILAFELRVPWPLGSEHRELSDTAPGLLEQLERRPTLRIELSDAILVGTRPVESITGGAIVRVDYLIDGDKVASADSPPFAASIDFGRLPFERRLAAIGFDEKGREVARDWMVINPGLQRLRLELVELAPLAGAVRARARLTRPLDSHLERVEWFAEDRRVVVSSTEPLIAILPLEIRPGEERPRFVRVIAHLDDGRKVEDTRFLDSDVVTDRVEVDLVQLFVRVTDRRGRPIVDLAADELEVLESGEAQTLHSFDHVTELPLQLALLVDVSGSILEKIELVRAAADAFLERVLRPRDQGAILAFRSALDVIAPFGPAPKWARESVSHFDAWGGTALWDSLALAASYAQGLPGKKAIVVVTDGDDRDSELTPADVEELAQRMGVAIYVIAVGLEPRPASHAPASSNLARHQYELVAAARDRRSYSALTRIAESTGGDLYLAGGEKRLNAVLESIERDLRSQYVVTFHSQQEGAGFRPLEVEVKRRGLRASTVSGYYP